MRNRKPRTALGKREAAVGAAVADGRIGRSEAADWRRRLEADPVAAAVELDQRPTRAEREAAKPATLRALGFPVPAADEREAA